MKPEIKARLKWVKPYKEVGNAGLVCRRCGISRSTLRKWYRRYQESGIDNLRDESRRPQNSPNLKVKEDIENKIIALRKKRKLNALRIQNELLRNQDFLLSLATIHKFLTRKGLKPLKRIRRKHQYKKYQRSIPGDRVQMDTMKIEPLRYQYTSIDDCARFRVLGLYKRRTAANTLLFLDRVL